MRFPLPLALALPVLLAAAADAPVPLRQGAWTFTNTPGTATLDGRELHDLPVEAATAETACLSPALAADPAAWLARDVAGDCRLTRRVVAGGRVDIAGTCPPRTPGYPAGRVTITGHYAADRYDLAFSTLSPDENGTMGFAGTMVGQRTGDCTK